MPVFTKCSSVVAPVKLDIQVHGVVEVDVDEAKNRNWKEHTQNITPIL